VYSLTTMSKFGLLNSSLEMALLILLVQEQCTNSCFHEYEKTVLTLSPKSTITGFRLVSKTTLLHFKSLWITIVNVFECYSNEAKNVAPWSRDGSFLLALETISLLISVLSPWNSKTSCTGKLSGHIPHNRGTPGWSLTASLCAEFWREAVFLCWLWYCLTVTEHRHTLL